MTDSRIIICPICGKKTLLRIQVGGYINKYPIRFNCMNCKTLIKGSFYMDDNSTLTQLTMTNAQTENPDVVVSKDNNIQFNNADYVCSISGELPCYNVFEYKGGLPLSPFMEATSRIPNIEKNINRLQYFANSINEWNKKKSIAFQLLDDGSIDYIAKALDNKLGNYKYECNHYLQSLHCLQNIVEENLKYLFIDDEDSFIYELLDYLRNTNKDRIDEFIAEIGGIEELISNYRKTIEVFSKFMSIYTYVLPAETYLYFKDKNDPNIGISTCTFNDIKNYFQDAYESLLSLMHIIVCLDNIILRGEFNKFNSTYNGTKHPKDEDFCLKHYYDLDNGTRANKIKIDEPYQRMLGLPANRLLRNAIGHNNFTYDGITQIIEYYDRKETKQTRLMDVAIECIDMAKSSLIMSEIILYCMRELFRKENITSIIHPRFYKNVEVNDQCPCGSGKKFKKCCMRDYKKIIEMNKGII